MLTFVKCQECGKEEEIQLYGSAKDREWKAQHHTCAACRAQARTDAAKTAEAQANDYLSELGKTVPALIGSEKQVSWALSIRSGFLLKLKEMHFSFSMARSEKERADMEKFWSECICTTSAAWWIDNRDNSPRVVIGDWMSKQH